MDKAATNEWFEYGYRLSDGTEMWEVDHGTDGSWTLLLPEPYIPAIDIYDGREVVAIYNALDKAGVEGVVIRKQVKRSEGPTETVERDAQ